MVNDLQVRRLKKMLSKGKTLEVSALVSGMDVKTARKYRELGKLPSELKRDRHWRTREDPFKDVWPEIRALLENNSGLESTTLFDWLQRHNPGEFQDGQLRTLQRKIKHWRAMEGPPSEVIFPQKHYPGILCQSDFTHMESLGVIINGVPFNHMIFHFVLTWSNWETGSICYSESFESLSEGLQKALWQLGGVPQKHQTDRLSAAVNNPSEQQQFTTRYQALLDHYGLKGQKIQPGKPNENGDVEQSHYRFKKAVDQALMLRDSRDFSSLQGYRHFLKVIFDQRNKGRSVRFNEEIQYLKPLPSYRIDAVKRFTVRVGPSSTIRVNHKVYSVHSRLIGETVTVLLHADKVEVKYGGRTVETLPRIIGSDKHRINYRHIIDSLVRKPGAFKNYRYRHDMFPNTHFRLAYDLLTKEMPGRSDKEYLNILYMAAYCGEDRITEVLKIIINHNLPISAELVRQYLEKTEPSWESEDAVVAPINIADYDSLLQSRELQHG